VSSYWNDSADELQERLRTSERVDSAVIDLLYEQLSAIRRLDRQLGATVAHEEVRVKIDQVKRLLSLACSRMREHVLPPYSPSCACLLAGKRSIFETRWSLGDTTNKER